MEMSEAPISTIHGLMKLEIKNWGTAKETPVTRMAGQTWSMENGVEFRIMPNDDEGNWYCPKNTV